MSIKGMVKKILNRLNYSKILMYHHITDSPEIKCSGCIISKEHFIDTVLSYSNFADIYTAVKYNRKGYTAITFDDGFKRCVY